MASKTEETGRVQLKHRLGAILTVDAAEVQSYLNHGFSKVGTAAPVADPEKVEKDKKPLSESDPKLPTEQGGPDKPPAQKGKSTDAPETRKE